MARKTREAETETASTNGYLLGISSGWDEASTWLLKKAGEFFVADRSKEAELLKALSKEAKAQSADARRKYDNHKSHGSTLDKKDLE